MSALVRSTPLTPDNSRVFIELFDGWIFKPTALVVYVDFLVQDPNGSEVVRVDPPPIVFNAHVDPSPVSRIDLSKYFVRFDKRTLAFRLEPKRIPGAVRRIDDLWQQLKAQMASAGSSASLSAADLSRVRRAYLAAYEANLRARYRRLKPLCGFRPFDQVASGRTRLRYLRC